MFTCEARLSKGDGGSQAVWPLGSPLQITTEMILSLRKFQPQGLPLFGCALGWPEGLETDHRFLGLRDVIK